MREPRYSILSDINDGIDRAKQGKLALYWQRNIEHEYRCKKVTPAEQQAYTDLQDILAAVPQTFVYMIPAVMLLGPGKVPAVLATVVYAVVPVIRLTSHGIRQVDQEVVEASRSFGSSSWQTLFKVQIPQALPTIMTGINQTMMMAVAMVVTCAMIGANGLGMEVLIAINRMESGRGIIAGFAIVIIAIIIDRLTQSLVQKEGK